MGWLKNPGPSDGEEVPRLFFWRIYLKELSIFIDESGDFGEYCFHSPYYIITMVFHNQTIDIQEQIQYLNTELSYLGLDNLCIHTGPIIRKEEIYKNMEICERRRIFNKMMAFIRAIDVKYKLKKGFNKMDTKIPFEGKYIMFKGKPLVRKDNIICYGDPKDPAVLVLTVLSTKKTGEDEIPDMILIQVQSTDTSLPITERVIKQGMKNGLYQALDFGASWLENSLN